MTERSERHTIGAEFTAGEGITLSTEETTMGKMDYEPIVDDTKWPICPFCEKEIEKVRYFEQMGVVAMKVIRLFVCPHCLKVLGAGMVGM